MRLKFILVCFVFIQLIISCKTDDQITIETEDYSLSYPSNLELVEVDGVEFLLFTELKGGNDDFIENLNLMVQDVTTLNLSLQDYVELSEGQIASVGGELMASDLKEKDDGTQYQRVIYTSRSDNKDLKYLQHYYLVNHKAYVLTFTAAESEFASYAHDMELIMDTFEVH